MIKKSHYFIVTYFSATKERSISLPFTLQTMRQQRKAEKTSHGIHFVIISDPRHSSARPAEFKNFITRKRLLTWSNWRQHHTHTHTLQANYYYFFERASEWAREGAVACVEHRKMGKANAGKTKQMLWCFYLANNGILSETRARAKV